MCILVAGVVIRLALWLCVSKYTDEYFSANLSDYFLPISYRTISHLGLSNLFYSRLATMLIRAMLFSGYRGCQSDGFWNAKFSLVKFRHHRYAFGPQKGPDRHDIQPRKLQQYSILLHLFRSSCHVLIAKRSFISSHCYSLG